MTSMRSILNGSRLPLMVALFLFNFSLSGYSADANKVKQEVEYAKTLNRWGLPDYAKVVLDKIDDPAAGPIIPTLRLV